MPSQSKKQGLTQMDAIRIVCKYLEEQGFLIAQSPLNNKRVNNILATLKGYQDVVIEVRGNTAAPRVRTGAPGRPYGSEQFKKHVEHAFYHTAQILGGPKQTGIALPKHPLYQKWINSILPALKVLEIELFWILPDGNIEALGH